MESLPWIPARSASDVASPWRSFIQKSIIRVVRTAEAVHCRLVSASVDDRKSRTCSHAPIASRPTMAAAPATAAARRRRDSTGRGTLVDDLIKHGFRAHKKAGAICPGLFEIPTVKMTDCSTPCGHAAQKPHKALPSGDSRSFSNARSRI